MPERQEVQGCPDRRPLGRLHPASEHFDTHIDFESLVAIGSMMGSGGLIVMDEDNCMVDIAKFFLEFTVDESCGKCAPCRIGTERIYEMLEKITAGKAHHGGPRHRLEELCYHVKSASLCALGQTRSQPCPVHPAVLQRRVHCSRR